MFDDRRNYLWLVGELFENKEERHEGIHCRISFEHAQRKEPPSALFNGGGVQ